MEPLSSKSMSVIATPAARMLVELSALPKTYRLVMGTTSVVRPRGKPPRRG
ncbi:hypothetical protein PGT21_007230 [Puccinia graminis f. sp. tritici]|uniref:Uncharacterized protein n=1 Tax=Puccinia graminis f. sp. tritici TaxID=56615 RepID=A0A5B0PQN9_PUCGR|nr:hypothetical protein PGT21_007230 [Puccinia graminis f. sp. tritici]